MWSAIFGLLIVATVVQIAFWSGLFGRLAFYRERPGGGNSAAQGVSVIICARNEAENLKKHLLHFLNQNYRSFEIIVVNDNSTDHTKRVLLDIQAKSPNLRVVNLDKPTPPGKKTALTKGIEVARFPVLLLTDADCRPAGPDWLAAMQGAIQGAAEVGLGYSPYERERGWLNRFIRYEAVFTAIQYLSYALAGMPYMGVGRNLVYSKSIFDRSGGFSRHLQVASGDDDLFVNEVANRNNTVIVLSKESFVYSLPKRTLRGYYNQKRRHLTTGRRYKPVHQLMLGMYSVSHFGHYLAGIVLLLAGVMVKTILLIYLARLIVVILIGNRLFRKLDQPDLIPWIPVLDASLVLYYFFLTPALFKGNTDRWK